MAPQTLDGLLNAMESLNLVQSVDRYNFPSATEILIASPADVSRHEAEAVASLNKAPVQLRVLSCQILDHFDGILEKKNEVNVVGVVLDGQSKERPIEFAVGSFVGIRKNDFLPIGDPGLSLYYAESLPRYLDVRLLIVEDDQGIRDLGAAIKQLQAQNAYKTLIDALVAAGSVPLQTVVRVSSAVISLIGALLEQNKDDKISLFAATYTLAFDRLGVGRHTFHQEGRARVQYEIRVL